MKGQTGDGCATGGQPWQANFDFAEAHPISCLLLLLGRWQIPVDGRLLHLTLGGLFYPSLACEDASRGWRRGSRVWLTAHEEIDQGSGDPVAGHGRVSARRRLAGRARRDGMLGSCLKRWIGSRRAQERGMGSGRGSLEECWEEDVEKEAFWVRSQQRDPEQRCLSPAGAWRDHQGALQDGERGKNPPQPAGCDWSTGTGPERTRGVITHRRTAGRADKQKENRNMIKQIHA